MMRISSIDQIIYDDLDTEQRDRIDAHRLEYERIKDHIKSLKLKDKIRSRDERYQRRMMRLEHHRLRKERRMEIETYDGTDHYRKELNGKNKILKREERRLRRERRYTHRQLRKRRREEIAVTRKLLSHQKGTVLSLIRGDPSFI